MSYHEFKHPIPGQEAIVSYGLGRVTRYADDFPRQFIAVKTYADNVEREYAPHNVKLVPPIQDAAALETLKRISHVLTTGQVRWNGDTVLAYISSLVAAGIANAPEAQPPNLFKGWSGYAWKDGQYVDDIQAFFDEHFK